MVNALSALREDRFIPLSNANTIHLVRRGMTGHCVSSGEAIERDDPYVSIDFPVRTGAVECLAYALIQIGGIDRFVTVFGAVSRENPEPLERLNHDEYTVTISPVRDDKPSVREYICPVCMEVCETGSSQVEWKRSQSSDTGYCHVECTDKLATIVGETWTYTDDILTDAL